MAQKVNIVLIDDLDGSDADETVSFGLDGKSYEIDLTKKNAAKLRDSLAPYVASARRGGSRRRATSARSSRPSEIRAWARDQGYDISERGRVATEIIEAYDAAH